LYIFPKIKKSKKNTNTNVRRAIKMNDALTIKLCTSKNKNKKWKSIFWTVAAWLHEKKWLTNESFSKSFFSSLCKSFTQSDSQNKTKNKTPLCLLFLLSECVVEEKLLLVIHHLKDLSLFCIIL
jgi:hypothetical protein